MADSVLEILEEMADFIRSADSSLEASRGTPGYARVRIGCQEEFLELYDKLLEVAASTTAASATSVRGLTQFIGSCDAFLADEQGRAVSYRPRDLRPLGEAIQCYDDRPKSHYRHLESIARLHETGVGPGQIKSIWGISSAQLEQELEQPGSVIGTAEFIDELQREGRDPESFAYEYGIDVDQPCDSGWVPPWHATYKRAVETARAEVEDAKVELREVIAEAKKHRQQSLEVNEGGRPVAGRLPPNPIPEQLAARAKKKAERDALIDASHR